MDTPLNWLSPYLLAQTVSCITACIAGTQKGQEMEQYRACGSRYLDAQFYFPSLVEGFLTGNLSFSVIILTTASAPAVSAELQISAVILLFLSFGIYFAQKSLSISLLVISGLISFALSVYMLMLYRFSAPVIPRLLSWWGH